MKSRAPIAGLTLVAGLWPWSALHAAGEGSCLDCHRKKTPSHVKVWQASAHARAKVGCAACHGSDHRRIEKGEAYVGAGVCGRCHREAHRSHVSGRHGLGLHSGWGCTRALSGRTQSECRFCHDASSARPISAVQCGRFLKQTQAMAEVGCNRCHEVERSCATCHSNHGTERRLPRDPAVCSKCHMGPDHPQWEMWQTSRHGMLHATLGKGRGATCQDCHLPDGGHDVSRGLTMSATGQLHAKARFVREREHMLKVCVRCHARAFAARELARADQVREQSVALVRQAEQVIREVARRGKLDPMPGRRPPHPQRGHALVLDGQMLYEDTSHLERLFFKMKLFDLAKTVKGAFHQNPAYAHWYGNAELKLTLVDIRAEAARLLARPAAAAPAKGSSGAALTPAETLEDALRELKERADRGELSPDAYRAAKAQLLRRFVGR